MTRTKKPREDVATLARWGSENLSRVIAIDSQSDEKSATIPSSDGQRVLSDHLRQFFAELGFATEQDDSANVIVTIPGNLSETGPETGPETADRGASGHGAPAVAMMVHMDTAEGTQAVPSLQSMERWDGSRVAYPENDRLQVTADNYPEITCFVGDDLLHGPGRFPIGLDDKLGMAELMTLAQILARNPEIPHGPVVLIFRPDEEIGRMAAVESLAEELARRGVRYGYTIDGIEPFEINVENFNASRAHLRFTGRGLEGPDRPLARRMRFRIGGVNTHGATAKPEGHRNATVIWVRALDHLDQRGDTTGQGAGDILAVDFITDARLECNAEVSFLVFGESSDGLDARCGELEAALEREVTPHCWKGAYLESLGAEDLARAEASQGASDAALQLGRHLRRFLATPGVVPVLSEDSEGFEGYSNPHTVVRDGDALVLHYRFRDFDPDGLEAREDHLRQVCQSGGIDLAALSIARQYINMGPALAAYPELATWAEEALEALGREPVRRPIRGGTGVDPFLEKNIPVANLGTGYFAPESEKELTSRQNIARHALWLTHLVQIVATAGQS